MIYFRTLIIIIHVVGSIVFSGNAHCSSDNEYESKPYEKYTAKQFVREFCKAEFNGVEERYYFIKFDETLTIRDIIISFEESPLYVIDRYRVLGVEVKGNKATATVSYRVFAISEGDSKKRRQLIKKHIKKDIVKISLYHDKTRWWVAEPTIPRVSRKHLLDYYSNMYNSLKKIFEGYPETTINKTKSIAECLQMIDFLKDRKK